MFDPSPAIVDGPAAPAPLPEYVLTLSCPDRPGIVYAVASFLVQHSCTILQSQQYDDASAPDGAVFFMRVRFRALDRGETLDRLTTMFGPVADSFRMRWELVDALVRPRALVLVSRFGHCLNDLLYRQRIGALPVDVPLVVSNHTDLEDLVTAQGVPFVHLPVPPDGKPAAEARLVDLVAEHRVDVVVLARYMQVLSAELCARLEGRAINIHHSFLPSFTGARPYGQAHDRGVKLIGATAHYVTATLDEGPIIEQGVTRIDHTFTVEAMAAAGRDVECQVLARAVTWHAERRVLLNGHRTIVFR